MSDQRIRAMAICVAGAVFFGLAGIPGTLRAGSAVGGGLLSELPAPYDGAVNVDPNGLVLSWWVVPGAKSYDVYFGPTPDSLVLLGSTTLPNRAVDAAMTRGKCYYWRVVARAGSTVLVKGPVRRFTTLPPAPTDAGLLAWYALDEGAGTTSRNLAGDGPDAQVENMAWSSEGAPGLDGASVQSEGAGWVHFQILAGVPPPDRLTLTGWFRIRPQQEPAALWSLGSGPGSYISLVQPANGGRAFLEILSPGLSQPVRSVVKDPLPLERWTHLAVLMDGPARQITVYEDGAVVWTAGGLTGLPGVLQQARDVFLGSSFVLNSCLYGGIDHVRLYAGSLDAQKIARTMLSHPDSPYEPGPRQWAQAYVGDPAVLKWQGSPAATRYNLYTGTEADHLVLTAGDLTRAERALTQKPAAGQTLYWRVDTVLDDGLIPGPLWQFSVTSVAMEDAIANETPWWIDYTKYYRRIVPDVSLTDADGRGHRFRDYRGRHLLVVVWAPWCSVCGGQMTELPNLRLATSEDELAILAITDENNRYILPGFLAGHPDITFPVCMTRLSSLPPPFSEISHIPSIFYIAPDGLLTLGTVGAVPQATMEAILAAAWPK